jgi:hypothetical protein
MNQHWLLFIIRNRHLRKKVVKNRYLANFHRRIVSSCETAMPWLYDHTRVFDTVVTEETTDEFNRLLSRLESKPFLIIFVPEGIMSADPSVAFVSGASELETLLRNRFGTTST